MKQRGRKSAASLAIQPSPVGIPRLPAPLKLSEAERGIWHDIVNALPANYFTEAQVPLLVALCRRVAKADVMAGLILDFRTEWTSVEGGLERLDKLFAAADREDRAIAALSRSLRLTLQSLRTAGSAATIHRDAAAAGTARPWD
jgi:hypothetical protein